MIGRLQKTDPSPGGVAAGLSCRGKLVGEGAFSERDSAIRAFEGTGR